jgi:hypothetical protein
MMFSTWCQHEESMVPMLTETTEVSEQQLFFNETKKKSVFRTLSFSPVGCSRIVSFHEPTKQHLQTPPGKSTGDYTATTSDPATRPGCDLPNFSASSPLRHNHHTRHTLPNLISRIMGVQQRSAGWHTGSAQDNGSSGNHDSCCLVYLCGDQTPFSIRCGILQAAIR